MTQSFTATVQETSRLTLRGALKVDGKRLNDTLHYSCSTPDGGMNRLALNDDDATVRRWFIEQVEALGAEVNVDSMGNIFSILKGELGGAPIAMGSHLDTQPTGGRYDGILGVQAGLEVLRVVKESGYKTKHPLAVVVWTNEEGARFIPSMLGSAVWSQTKTIDFGHAVTDNNGISVKDELVRHSFLGDIKSSYEEIPLKAHFELHIEQGPILEESNNRISPVSGVQALRWFEIKLQGRGSHAGTTPMAYRRDPLAVFAAMAQKAEQLAVQHGGMATIGRIWSESPQSTNCVLDDLVFHLDLRHHRDDYMDKLEADVRKAFTTIIAEAKDIKMTRFDFLTGTSAVAFDPVAVSCVREACKGLSDQELISGAGHDSVHTSKRCPTAMVFVRSRDGISHHPSEYSSPEDITIGAQVLLDAVLAYDRRVAA